jgi:hypothetical protein
MRLWIVVLCEHDWVHFNAAAAMCAAMRSHCAWILSDLSSKQACHSMKINLMYTKLVQQACNTCQLDANMLPVTFWVVPYIRTQPCSCTCVKPVVRSAGRQGGSNKPPQNNVAGCWQPCKLICHSCKQMTSPPIAIANPLWCTAIAAARSPAAHQCAHGAACTVHERRTVDR